MNRRLIKEARALLLPWSISVTAGVVLASRLMLNVYEDPFESSIVRVATFVFFGALVITCALSFGTELQQRTLPLLLAQPIPRARLWSEKLLVLAVAVVVAILIHCVVQLFLLSFLPFTQPHLDLEPRQILLAGSFLLATVCAAGFWTLLARSTIGGMVFCASSLGILGMTATFVVQKTMNLEFIRFGDANSAPAIVVTWLICSPILLWLGWRMFARLEVKGASLEESASFSVSEPRAGTRWRSDWLRCRPTGGLLNLVRKELLLHKPVFQIAAVFIICWLATLLLVAVQQSRHTILQWTLNFLTGAYVPLSLILAGCVPLGEEKTLGLANSNLTLPISARRQWAVKLSVTAVVGVMLCLVLPYVLAWLTSAKAGVGLFGLIHAGRDSYWQAPLFSALVLLLVSALILFTSFWAATFLSSAVRAALISVLGLTALVTCAVAGSWCSGKFFGLESGLLTGITARFQLAPDYFNLVSTLRLELFSVPLFTLGPMLALLMQSFAQFRRAQVRAETFIKNSLIVASIAFLTAFWIADFKVSATEQANSRLVKELKWAVSSLLVQKPLLFKQSRVVSIEELAQTGRLSSVSRRWLKNSSVVLSNASVMLSRVPEGRGNFAQRQFCTIGVTFPNLTQFNIVCDISE